MKMTIFENLILLLRI